jgi:hypothetical protein
MKKIEDFVLLSIKKIEREFNVVAWGNVEYNEPKTFSYWNIHINDYNVYQSDLFRKISKSLYKIAVTKYKIKLLFCYQNPNEDMLMKLADEGNLIMNV